jgi:hypothetical protein
MDKVHPERTLLAAFYRVAANEGAAGVDHVSVTMFEDRLDENLKDLSDALRTGTYRPQAIRRHYTRRGRMWHRLRVAVLGHKLLGGKDREHHPVEPPCARFT